MALPAVGDGYQVGDGNLNETQKVGRIVQTQQFGGTGGVIGMYGATPIVQRATAASHTTIATSAAYSTLTTGSASTWGYSTSSQANQITAAIAEIQATLVALGIWAA